MEQIRRIRRSESMWRELVVRQATSGASVQDFCCTERLNAAVFRRWRLRLKWDGKGAKGKAAASARIVTPFIDIGAVDGGRSRFEVRLELGAGMILSIARG